MVQVFLTTASSSPWSVPSTFKKGEVPTGYVAAADQSWTAGYSSSFARVRQSFTVASNGFMDTLYCLVAKVGFPSDSLQCMIYDDTTSEVLKTTTLPAAQLSFYGNGAPAWFVFDQPIKLLSTHTYSIIWSRTGAMDTGNYYNLRGTAAAGYAGGQSYIDNGSWAATTGDLVFEVMRGTHTVQLLGAGGKGAVGTTGTSGNGGGGGSGGNWTYLRHAMGSDITAGTTTITFNVKAGGAGAVYTNWENTTTTNSWNAGCGGNGSGTAGGSSATGQIAGTPPITYNNPFNWSSASGASTGKNFGGGGGCGACGPLGNSGVTNISAGTGGGGGSGGNIYNSNGFGNGGGSSGGPGSNGGSGTGGSAGANGTGAGGGGGANGTTTTGSTGGAGGSGDTTWDGTHGLGGGGGGAGGATSTGTYTITGGAGGTYGGGSGGCGYGRGTATFVQGNAGNGLIYIFYTTVNIAGVIGDGGLQSYTLNGATALLPRTRSATLPQVVDGISTAVAPVGPFKFGPIEHQQWPIATVSSNYQDFGSATFITRCGTKYTAATNNRVTKLKVSLEQIGSPIDNIQAYIFNEFAGYPSGSNLGVSDPIAGSSLDTLGNEVYVTFNFSTPVNQVAGQSYCWILIRDGSPSDTDKYGLFITTQPQGSQDLIYFTTSWSTATGSCPPYQLTTDGSPAYFMFGVAATVNSKLVAMQLSTISGWVPVASVDVGAQIQLVRAFQKGETNIIHLLILCGSSSAAYTLYYCWFDCGTRTFSPLELVMGGTTVTGGLASGWGCDLYVRHMNQVLVIYNSAQTSSRARLSFKEKAFGTWGSATQVDDNTATDNSKPSVSCGFPEILIFNWVSSGTNKFLTRTLDEANSLGTQNGITTAASAWGGTVSYKEPFSATKTICAGEFNAYFDEPGSTINTTSNTAAGDTRRVFVDEDTSNKVWYLYINATDNDVYAYSSTNDGATLSPSATGTAVMTATATQAAANLSMDGKFYLRGVNYVLPYFVNDAGTLKYNEYTVRTSGKTLDATGAGSYTLTGASTTNLVKTSIGKAPPPYKPPRRIWNRRYRQ